MTKIKFCSVCGSILWIVWYIKGKPSKNDRIEITTTTKSLNDFLQEKRKDRQKFILSHKSLGCHKTRSDAKPSHKIVDTSVITEVGITDMSKGNLEPVRGSSLPVKVGNDMKQQEICQLAIEKHCYHDQFFSNLEQYV